MILPLSSSVQFSGKKKISQLVHVLLMVNLVGHITMYSLLNSRIFVCILFSPL